MLSILVFGAHRMHLVITSCTNRKRFPAPAAMRATVLKPGPLEKVAAEWVKCLHGYTERVPANHLYAGRGFVESVQAASISDANLAIVSAGLGLVGSGNLVPPYALSVAGASADNVLSRISDDPEPSDWWRAISAGSPFSSGLAEVIATSPGVVIVALSEAYLAMVSDDLVALPKEHADRLRIVTRAPVERINEALRDRIMPYDDRLDGPDSAVRGTRGDFAPRAARHFAQVVLAELPCGSAEAHAKSVAQALAPWRTAPCFERVRHDDDTLLQIINAHWNSVGGQSSKLLRVLRDDLNIACEQGRFVSLMKRLRAEREVAA